MSVSIETVRFANTKNNEDCKTNETIGKRRVEYVATACLDDIFAEIKDTDFKIFRKDLTSNEGLVELFRVEEEDGYKEPLGTNQGVVSHGEIPLTTTTLIGRFISHEECILFRGAGSLWRSSDCR